MIDLYTYLISNFSREALRQPPWLELVAYLERDMREKGIEFEAVVGVQ